MPQEDERVHRGLFWSAVLFAVLAVVGGAIVAIRGYGGDSGPDGVVRGYFGALADGDAPAALSYGDLPAGPHTLLTSKVLREQQRIAPISDVQVVAVNRAGARASVSVRYRLGFHGDPQNVTDILTVVRRGDSWQLARTAVATELHLSGALPRARIVGAGIPAGSTLLFPGAVPVSFDSPYLQADPASAHVGFDAGSRTEVAVRVSPEGRAAVIKAIERMLRECLAGAAAGKADPRCPLPSPRYVPGSISGTVDGSVADTVQVDVQGAGLLVVSGTARVSGSYQELDFNNIAHDKKGSVELNLSATGYAVKELRLQWTDPR
jgi:hypothetical protein